MDLLKEAIVSLLTRRSGISLLAEKLPMLFPSPMTHIWAIFTQKSFSFMEFYTSKTCALPMGNQLFFLITTFFKHRLAYPFYSIMILSTYQERHFKVSLCFQFRIKVVPLDKIVIFLSVFLNNWNLKSYSEKLFNFEYWLIVTRILL